MLITFHSKAAANVTMYEQHAEPFLKLLHKEIKRGVITAAETDNAIAVLEGEIKHHENFPPEEHQHIHTGDTEEENAHPLESVRFGARFYPLLDMLRESHKQQCDILWGV